jgi:hypothetical protein
MEGDWEQIAAIGVDAGLVWLGDPCYTMTPDTPYVVAPSWQEFVRAVFAKMANTDIARFEKSDDWGDIGVAVQSGLGDGVYPVYVRRDSVSGRIAELRVEFLPHPSN